MTDHIFTGFGFGPIQSGLFVAEAYASGNFDRIIIAEIDQKLVDAVRANNGRYAVNIASNDGIEIQYIKGVEIYNPMDATDRGRLLDALCCSTEICTSLPSVDFYRTRQNSVASLIAQGLQSSSAAATIVYTAENNNHAAEILEENVRAESVSPFGPSVQFLNTVIGKMSQVVINNEEIIEKKLAPITPGIGRAFLVEKFNKILVTKNAITHFKPGIEVFIEKEDLLPFEEAKLYGHNAIHALLAYLGSQKGYRKMSELENDPDIMQIARHAFIDESGAALIRKYAHLNEELFTPAGYQAYADDLLKRMTNPWLGDTVERAARDPHRKLSRNDRIFGTIQLAIDQGIEPLNCVKGALAALEFYKNRPIRVEDIEPLLTELWQSEAGEYNLGLVETLKKYYVRSNPAMHTHLNE
ncbi:MAG: hypothetical protein LLF76_12185 [Planctomycetaceae bacterium]|nr:hypothetical protein [Planctomycetaceae bacterium]